MHLPGTMETLNENRTTEMKRRIAGISIGATIGALLGAGTGIVGGFGGVSGMFVFAVIGGIIGLLAVPDARQIGSFLRSFRK